MRAKYWTSGGVRALEHLAGGTREPVERPAPDRGGHRRGRGREAGGGGAVAEGEEPLVLGDAGEVLDERRGAGSRAPGRRDPRTRRAPRTRSWRASSGSRSGGRRGGGRSRGGRAAPPGGGGGKHGGG